MSRIQNTQVHKDCYCYSQVGIFLLQSVISSLRRYGANTFGHIRENIPYWTSVLPLGLDMLTIRNAAKVRQIMIVFVNLWGYMYVLSITSIDYFAKTFGRKKLYNKIIYILGLYFTNRRG